MLCLPGYCFGNTLDTLWVYNPDGSSKKEVYGGDVNDKGKRPLVEKELYYPNGQVKSLSRYAGQNTQTTAWYPNGMLRYKFQTTGNFEPNGEVVSYYQNGQLKSKVVYEKGSLKGKGESYDSAGNPTKFIPLVEPACFGRKCKDSRASLESFRSYIFQNVVYPRDALNDCVQGRVAVQFTIDEEGKVGNVKLLISAGHSSVDKAAIRVVESSPKWTPLRIDGEASRIVYKLPIIFQLERTPDGSCTPVWGTTF